MFCPEDIQKNRLLAALSPAERERIYPALRLVQLPAHAIFHEAGDALRDLCFPIDSIVSQLYVTTEGATVEISSVGNEGAAGIAVFLGGASRTHRAIVQGAGHGYLLSRAQLAREFVRHGELVPILLRYTNVLLAQMGQSASCYRHHSLLQRLCRWLLQYADRRESRRLETTHEFIAMLLGVRREGVTAAIGELQHLGAITHGRGHVTVLSHEMLAQLSCECYAAMRQQAEHLLPAAAHEWQPRETTPSREAMAPIVAVATGHARPERATA
jgi:CRP-like cAMP-binding protein